MKWIFLLIVIGYFANALNFSKKSDVEDDDSNYTVESSKFSISIAEKEKEEEDWNTKERILWLLGGVAALIVFFLF